jgi:hypothetical protein
MPPAGLPAVVPRQDEAGPVGRTAAPDFKRRLSPFAHHVTLHEAQPCP